MGTSEGVIKVRTVRRKGDEGPRWSEEVVSTMKRTPWELVPGREGIEVRSRVAPPEGAKAVPMAREFDYEERVRRRPKIEKTNVEKFGISSGYPGCVAASRGATSRHHTEARRKRME